MKTSIIIPANNEAAWIGLCLEAVFRSKRIENPEVIVVANGCTDKTVAVANRYQVLADELGWTFKVIELSEGNKLKALNAGENHAQGRILVYLDADVRVSDYLLFQMERALDRLEPAWSSGQLLMAAASPVSRAYARFWQKTPFMAKSVPGSGIFGVNRPGRDRWERFPDIISDDMFVRLQFAPRERIGVPATYIWPVAEGWKNLIKVRRRQNIGVAQLKATYPELMKNEDKGTFSRTRALSFGLGDPFGFFTYTLVALIVRFTTDQDNAEWSRGR